MTGNASASGRERRRPTLRERQGVGAPEVCLLSVDGEWAASEFPGIVEVIGNGLDAGREVDVAGEGHDR